MIAEDPVFKRLGDDLYVDVDIDLYTALLGGEKLVDTLEGQVKLKVKPKRRTVRKSAEREGFSGIQERRRPVT